MQGLGFEFPLPPGITFVPLCRPIQDIVVHPSFDDRS